MTTNRTRSEFKVWLDEASDSYKSNTNKLIGEGKVHDAVSNLVSSNQWRVMHGIMNWKEGKDPRPDFESVVSCYENMKNICSRYQIDMKNETDSFCFAALFMMDYGFDPSENDNGYYKMNRWPLYTSSLIHALCGVDIGPYREKLLAKYLSKHKDVPDRSIQTYLALAGGMASDRPISELVAEGEANWNKRRTARFFHFTGGPDGYGSEAEWFVDLYLAAAMKKAGWDGDSPHVWKWGS